MSKLDEKLLQIKARAAAQWQKGSGNLDGFAQAWDNSLEAEALVLAQKQVDAAEAEANDPARRAREMNLQILKGDMSASEFIAAAERMRGKTVH